MVKLLRELTEQVDYIREEKDGKTNLFLQGPFMQAEIGNRNKRFYPKEILQNEAARFIKENIDRKCGYGELGHPPGPNINLERVAILIKELKESGNNFIGKALVASTPLGNIVSNLISDGARLGVSTRALGSLKMRKDGLNEVQDDLKLLAIDVVADPSGPDCWTDAIMEGSEYIWNAAKGSWEEYVDNTRKTMMAMSAHEIQEQKVQLFEAFIDRLTHSNS
jgi:hypothetical protein